MLGFIEHYKARRWPNTKGDAFGYEWAEKFFLQDFSNIYHGLTVCKQQEADEKIPIFLQVPGKKFLSIEPMLEAIDIRNTPLPPCDGREKEWPGFDAVILGGETGPGARPMNSDWVRSVRDQCAVAGVPFFFKGWGAWKGSANFTNGKMDVGSERRVRLLDGRTHDALPWHRDYKR